jgi:hypothetical protein
VLRNTIGAKQAPPGKGVDLAAAAD